MNALDDRRIDPRAVQAPVSAEAFKRHMATFADDAGLVRDMDPRIAAEIQYSLVDSALRECFLRRGEAGTRRITSAR